MEQEPFIGIDLGTTNSVVAMVQGGQATVIKNRAGSHLTPSVMAVTPAGKRLVGAIARRQAITNAENTAWAVKRLIGRKYSSPKVQETTASLPYKVSAGEHDDLRIELGGTSFSPQELSAQVLTELRLDAEAWFGRPVRRAVITVPAHFNDGQRQATRDAGRIAGLEVLRIINEPTAAALAYGFGKQVDGRIAVFDLGGGTFDISVLQVGGGVFEVLATGGDTLLGGEDFDRRIVEWLAFQFLSESGIDLRQDRMALQRLREAAEKAKIELSESREAHISLPFISTPKAGGSALHLQRPLGRAKLEELTGDLIDRCIAKSRETLQEAGVKASDLREVVLVGGMTRMPRVAEAVRQFFGREPCKSVHPDEVVALGAAIQASALVEGPETPQESVVLLDVTPHSLGVAVVGGYARALIPRNTTVPTSTTQLFSTSRDQQQVVRIMVLQGEEELAARNELLGEFVLSGLRPAPRGEVEVEVTFDISADGILSASATDLATGKQQSITVTAGGGLTREELQKILEEQADYQLEAASHQETQTRRREVSALVGDLEEVLPSTRELVQRAVLGPEVLAKAERQLENARGACAEPGLTRLTAARDDLTRTLAALRGVIGRLGKDGS